MDAKDDRIAPSTTYPHALHVAGGRLQIESERRLLRMDHTDDIRV
jgi:hypothetical protein